MRIGLVFSWAIRQAFGYKKGEYIIALLAGPLGILLNAATQERAQQVVDEINGIARDQIAQLNVAAGNSTRPA